MCTLYSVLGDEATLRAMFDARLGSLSSGAKSGPRNAIFPDQHAPVVRASGGERELLSMRWGFPPPQGGARPVVNARNLQSSYWQPWLGPAHRCLVPATSFCEWTDSRPKVAHWFALGSRRPTFAFAGIWRPWHGIRRGEQGDHLLFSFLTCPANDEVAPIHAKAMPVVLSEPDEWQAWLNAPPDVACQLQRPLPARRLETVQTGSRSDPGETEA